MNMFFKARAQIPLDTIERELLRSMGVDGLFARTERYERVTEAVASLISQFRGTEMEVLRFPPVMSRGQLEKSGYLSSFPNLLGCVNCLEGTEAEIGAAVGRFKAGGDWTSSLSSSEMVLTPAACYPLYPMVAQRGTIPPNGLRFDVACDCFRHEPSRDLDRLQSFRMREFVCIGRPRQIKDFRQDWIARGSRIASELALDWQIEQASDPFFGRTGQLLALSQMDAALKFELLIPLRGNGRPTACMSFNYHKDHFGHVWDLRSENGEFAHTGCVAFGIDRLALALFVSHGLELVNWPASVRKLLNL